MRILKLRLCNLNSLSGEWEIDFTHPDYVNEGLFAIVGPTGAGKSTILDAICLALYGQTPRLGRITKSDNDIMSRQHGECWAEVSFSTEQGAFRAHWYQHRARKLASGPLQGARHELSELTSGRILEEKLSLVPAQVEQLSGLDFERFTRSVMLAQGQFAAFLHADDSQRSELLEQLTGTDIYADISKKVFHRAKQTKDELQQLKSSLGDVELLSEEAQDELSKSMAAYQQELNQFERTLHQRQQAAQWVQRLTELRHKKAKLDDKENLLAQQLKAFESKREALKRDQEIRPHASDIKQCEYFAEQTKLLKQRLLELNEETQRAIKAHDQVAAEQTEQEAEHQQLLQQWRVVEPQIEAAVKLDQALEFTQQRLEEARSQQQTLEAEHQALMSDINARQQQLTEEQESLSERERWLEKHQERQQLPMKVALLEQSLTTMQQQSENETALEAQITSLQESFQTLEQRPVDEQYRQQQQALREQQRELERTLQQVQQDTQQFKLQQRFEQQRHLLSDGQPCPLCGAKEHPLTAHETKQDASLDMQLMQNEERQLELQQQLKQVSERWQTLNLEQAVTASEQKQGLAELSRQLQQTYQQLEALKQAQKATLEKWRPLLQAYQLLPKQELQPQLLVESLPHLEELAREYEQKAGLLTSTQQTLAVASQELTQAKAQQGKLAKACKEQNEQYQRHAQAMQDQREQRQQYFNGAPTSEVRAKHQKLLQQSEQKLQHVVQEAQKLRDRRLKLEQQIEHAQESLSRYQQQYDVLIKQLTTLCTDLGYDDVKALARALLTDNEYRVYSNQAQQLAMQQQQLEAEAKLLQQQLAEATAHQPEDAELNQQHIADLKQQLAQRQQALGAAAEKLRQHEQASARYQRIVEQIEQQQQQVQDWELLNGMIGSQEGKKYRNFAQGLTFAVMIDYANEKLKKMTDRYLLVHDHLQGLNVNVIDDYQAGEVRSTKNLSGGESFIVSLALALGLAQMASSRVRVDSLFLDEGFGTLDPDTLDTALDTLASLRQEEKMIGLISHVGALQDRIPTQLSVVPGSAGRSMLKGPGVNRVGETSQTDL